MLVEAEQNEMKINMAEKRLQPRTRYHSPRWKMHRKLPQIILWNFWGRKKVLLSNKKKTVPLIYISINCGCMCNGRAARSGGSCWPVHVCLHARWRVHACLCWSRAHVIAVCASAGIFFFFFYQWRAMMLWFLTIWSCTFLKLYTQLDRFHSS